MAFCFQPVNTHPTSYVACCVVGLCKQLFVLAEQYTSEFYVACCVVGICKKLFVSSRSIPIRILCCMLCCGQLQEMTVCLKPVNTHPNCILHVVVVGICKTLLFVSNRPITIRILCCMLCFGYLQIAVCFQLVNTHPNSMLHVVLWVVTRNSFLFQPVNTHPNSMLHVVFWVSASNSCLFLAGQYPSEFYVACCVAGICKKLLFVSSRSIPI